MTLNKSEMQLQAILYLMDDPSLDRAAFEARLSTDDGQLAEILADSVLIVQQLQSACKQYVASDTDDANKGSMPPAVVLPQSGGLATASFWSLRLSWIASIAASVLVVGSLSVWSLFSNNEFPIVSQSESSQEGWDPFSSSSLLAGVDLDSVVVAWSDMHFVEQEEPTNPFSLAARDCLACDTEMLSDEGDLPEWMLMVASVGGLSTPESDVN